MEHFLKMLSIKARHASKIANLPAIADDSGLCVDVLNGRPGILSARFSGAEVNDKKNNDKLLSLLKNKKIEKLIIIAQSYL